MADTDTPRVEHHSDRQRFEILVDGEVAAYAEYRQSDPTVRDFDHTVTLPQFRGRGLAGILVGQALDDTREAGMKVIPTCSYVHHFIDKHDEYADLTV
ncbi:MAG: GNAT family N-acetyltransferase [Rhodococcus sp. (in: high G+C Gram-positive bacteria)]